MIEVITCLHPERDSKYHEMLVRMMAAQTCPEFDWLVIGNDPSRFEELVFSACGGDALPYGFRTILTPGTMQHNMAAGLSQVSKGDFVIFMEDDDYYAPTWIEHCVNRLQKRNVYSEMPLYYDVKTRRHRCITKSGALGHSAVCGSEWQRILRSKLLYDRASDFDSFPTAENWSARSIGIKSYHPMLDETCPVDPNCEKLAAIVKDPVILEFYKGMYR